MNALTEIQAEAKVAEAVKAKEPKADLAAPAVHTTHTFRMTQQFIDADFCCHPNRSSVLRGR